MNGIRKYVVSRSLKSTSAWRNSTLIRENVADEIRKREADLHFFLVTLAVDRQGNLARLPHVDSYALPVARAYAFSSARRDMTVARC